MAVTVQVRRAVCWRAVRKTKGETWRNVNALPEERAGVVLSRRAGEWGGSTRAAVDGWSRVLRLVHGGSPG
ncbi:hypothetical protein GCM10010390_25470 [Streptomyces mordarskii]|uniref:Transposase n=1 Tax=Streptomyces mordarskii TaxID=1226758 RepID=A0ABN1CMN2_9ACTN